MKLVADAGCAAVWYQDHVFRNLPTDRPNERFVLWLPSYTASPGSKVRNGRNFT
jgi:hypothetical protein